MPFFRYFNPEDGIQGPAGMSAFDVAVMQGTYTMNPAWTLDENINAWLESLIGDQGPSGIPAVFSYTQSTPITTWVLVHGIGYRPNVNVVNFDGEVVYCAITHLNTDSLRLDFAEPFAGIATLS